ERREPRPRDRPGVVTLTGMIAAAVLAAAAQSVTSAGDSSSLALAASRYALLAERGGWAAIPKDRLARGAEGQPVLRLRSRLAVEGYPIAAPDSGERFDPGLESLVRRFQELHGLAADGVVGPATRSALDVPAAARLGQIRANLARLRTGTPPPGGRYLVVNIPAFTLEVVDSGRVMFSLRVIVGRPDWPTPVLSAEAREIVFAPAWRIPRSIAVADVLPILKERPEYLDRNGIRVFAGGPGGPPVDPSSVDWASVTARSFSYWFIQDPGPLNPLGAVKLVLETPEGVHLHDTPARSLFERRRRTFSHGCIRMEHPERLVGYLFPGWSPDSVAAAMASRKETFVPLPAPIAVHLVYRTAWVEHDGMVAFREDPYRLDRR
ncbi:MAG TPA: L,D-transpeptidase family protein, partial [Gemmatimonadales bacterium]